MNLFAGYTSEAVKSTSLLQPQGDPAAIVASERKKDRRLAAAAGGAGAALLILIIAVKGPGAEAAAVMFMTVCACGAVPALRIQKRRRAVAERREQLEVAFSDLTGKLSVLLGAGMSARSAWDRIAGDYAKELKSGSRGRNYLYEEMELVRRLIKQGYSEEEAMTRFGERTGLPCYLRLVNLLEAERRSGGAEVRKTLAVETREAFENRLTIARRQGEKISSKLLLPMIAMFAMVVLILIIPAFMRW